MSFVFPVLLGGVLLAGIPVLLHLIMRQKPKVLLFPAFRFLLLRHKKNQRKLRLRHIVLLALRVLLIVAVCLALARPKLFDVGFNLQSDRPVAAVFVFDTSPSMEYRTSDGQTRLADAQKRGLEMLDELPEGSRIAILDTAELGVSGPGEWLKTVHQAREKIQNLRIAPAGGPVTHRLEGAYRLLAELARSKDNTGAARLPRLLCVFSDRTRGAWDQARLGNLYEQSDQVPPLLEGLQEARGHLPALKGLLKDLRQQLPPAAGQDYPEQPLLDDIDKLLERIPGLTPEDLPPRQELANLIALTRSRAREVLARLPAEEQTADDANAYRAKLVAALQRALRDLGGVHALFIDVGLDRPADLAITDIELPRSLTGQVRQVFGANERFIVRAQVQATGKDFVNELHFTIGKEVYKKEVSLKAGERAAYPFEIDAAVLNLQPGPQQIEFRLKARDQLSFNDTRFLTFSIREPRRVLILADDADRPAEFRRNLAALGYDATIKTAPDENLAGYKAVYLFSLGKPTEALWKQLDEYVRQGGSLGIIPGDDTTDPDDYNKGAAQKLMPGELLRVQTKGDAKEQAGGVAWDFTQDSIFQHQALRKFREWRNDPTTDFIANPRRTFFYWEVKPHPKEASPLVSYADESKHAALVERHFDKDHGRVVLFTTRMDYLGELPWNNFLQNSFYLVITSEITNYLAGNPDDVSLNFTSGQGDPVVTIPATPRYPVYNLRGPELFDPIPVTDKQTELRVKQATAPGNYSIEGAEGGGSSRLAAFSVNLPSQESNLSRVPPREIETLLGPDAVLALDRRADIREALRGQWREPVELFPFLMVLLLFVLALENLLANKFYKKEATEEQKV